MLLFLGVAGCGSGPGAGAGGRILPDGTAVLDGSTPSRCTAERDDTARQFGHPETVASSSTTDGRVYFTWVYAGGDLIVTFTGGGAAEPCGRSIHAASRVPVR